MELRESIESINAKLLYEYGVEISAGNLPKFRVVFSNDCYEKRLTDRTDEGFELIQPEVRLLPKYKQWIHEKYILERLVPVVGETDLVTKVSYEPAWVFQDKNGNYLPPFFDGCKFVIESIFSAIDKANTHTKYKDKNISVEERRAELKKVEQELFGNETDVSDALSYGTGVVVTENKLLQKAEKVH
ncbi:hypothetical protein HYZ97_02755 [Candidatus Pacearchaeota archaeon]|nr:hypothetical protein [Candidatus Pacearchaeota archaeon]